MYFMFTILVITFLIIVNPVLGVKSTDDAQSSSNKTYQGMNPYPTEDEVLESVFTWVKNWLKLCPDLNLTIGEFYEFVGDDNINKHFVEGYFMIDPASLVNIDAIDVCLFKILIRSICIGTNKDPVQYTNELVAKYNVEIQQEILERRAMAALKRDTRKEREAMKPSRQNNED